MNIKVIDDKEYVLKAEYDELKESYDNMMNVALIEEREYWELYDQHEKTKGWLHSAHKRYKHTRLTCNKLVTRLHQLADKNNELSLEIDIQKENQYYN